MKHIGIITFIIGFGLFGSESVTGITLSFVLLVSGALMVNIGLNNNNEQE